MDRISGLSDELLVKILLFVPTKVAVSTSVLSKRWEYLWMWLPKLDYVQIPSSPSQCKRLRSFLDRNLPLHRAPVIESFRLELCGLRFKRESVKLWVVLALSHRLRELEIFYYPDPAKSNILPSNLYTCKSLVILKLDGEILLDVPRTVFLPSLKTLKLESVRYLSEESLQRLLSNCPILEDLVVHFSYVPSNADIMRKLTVMVPSLQSFSVFIPYDYDIDGIVLKAPSLKYLDIVVHNPKSQYCLIEDMPNLIEAHVDVEFPDIKSLIGLITSVKTLKICSEAMCDEGFVFNHLEHLKLCGCKDHWPKLLFRLLKDSTNLQVLDVFLMDNHEPDGMEFWNQPSTVPECMLSSLQSLNWFGYAGDTKERDLVVYILKHALHLKTATIESVDCDIPRLEMLKELARAPRASATCQLMFD